MTPWAREVLGPPSETSGPGASRRAKARPIRGTVGGIPGRRHEVRISILCLAVLTALASRAPASRSAKDPAIDITAAPRGHAAGESRASALVVSVHGDAFTNLGYYYRAALDSTGHAADLIYDPMGDWPDLGGYDIVLVSFSDLWWPGYWSEIDEAVLAAYLDDGGRLIMIGQDYLLFRGTITGFPMDYLGVCGYENDVCFGDATLDWDGTAGGPLADMGGSATYCCTNAFYTDSITPCTQGLVLWTSPSVGTPTEGGSAEEAAVFSSVEFACGPGLRAVVAALKSWLGVSPVRSSTWGAIKTLYR